MNEPLLPDNDPELKLARKLGALLEKKEAPFDSDERPFVARLRKFKQSSRSLHRQSLPDASVSAALWTAIQAEMEPAPSASNPPARIYSIRPIVYRVAVAASLLVALTLGWYFTRALPEPVLIAAADQRVALHTLPDGSRVQLRPHSSLYRVSEQVEHVVFRLDGEAFFDVTTNPGRTFTVEAGELQVSVLGTEFNVSTWGDAVSVYLEEGSVELKNAVSGQAVRLEPGQNGSAGTARPEIQVLPASPDEYLDWLENKISFTGMPLSTIVQELEFHFAINIEIPADRTAETLTGPILLDDVSTALDQLSFVMDGGRFVPIDETTYRFEAN